MTISEVKGENSIQLSVEGQVDTVTAPELQQKILTCFQKTKDVVLDLAEVGYMSSAGLRIMLSSQKTMDKQGKMTVRNVNATIMDIFEITGFTDFLTIEN